MILLSVICTISCVSAIDHDSNSSEIISDSVPGELSEIHVSPDGSDDAGDGSLQKPFKSIEHAVNMSKNDSTVYLNNGEYAGVKNREITIDKSITIIGKSKENTIINGESMGRLFNVNTNSRLTLINLTLINGHSAENGGLIHCNGGEINIRNCIVKNTTGDADGGVIYNNLGVLNIENTCFTDNSGYHYGGVIYTLGKTSIKNTNFTKNVLTSPWGVGACIAAGGNLNLDGCIFSDCFTTYAAAGVLSLGNATVNNCRFERLATNYTAGGISNHGYMVINNSYFGYNDVQYYAAAILAPPSGHHVTTIVYNTIFERNHAGFHAAVSNNYKDTELYMQNCAFIDNYIVENKIYGDIALDDNATVQYCWWGTNEINPYYYSPHNSDKRPEKINASRWLVMTFTAKDNVIYKNEINQLTVSLKHYFDNVTKEVYEYNDEFDLPLDVTFFTNAGTLATKKLVNGEVTFDFNPQEGVNSVYARINDQTLKIDNFQLRKTDIIVDDIEKYYGSNTQLVMKLIKDNNVAISNEQLTVSVGGIYYIIKTDKNGIAKFNLKNTPANYIADIAFYGNDYIWSSKSVSVKIVKPIMQASKLKVHKKGKFSVTFKDADKKAIKNVKVTFKIKGKTYVEKTDSNGKASIKINLKPGKYTVKVGFKDTSYYGTTTLTKKIKVIR